MIPVSCDPEGKLDRVPLDQIEEFQGNLKSLGKTEYAKLKQSITEKGFCVPCFAWRNGSDKWKLLDGHQRVRVIRNEGWEIDGGIPIVEIAAEDERDAKEKLLAIVSRYGRVEGQGLYEFLDGTGIDLEQWAVPDLPDLDLDSWLDEFMRDPEVPPGDPEAVPEVPEEATTQRGDLWVLGDHRVLCGDATSVDDVEKLMAGVNADLIWTDPPYGVNHVGGTKDPRRKTYRSGGVVNNDNKTGGDLVTMVSDAIGLIPRHKSTVLYVASPGGANVREMIDAFNASGFQFRHSLVWVKHAFVFGRADYHYKHELILYGWGERHEWIGERDMSTVFEFPRGDKTVDHPTSKPVGLIVETSKNHPEGVMADPFLGSGTTLIAAEQLGRCCYGMEIDPKYVDVIVKRWEDYTGKTAVLEQSKAA